ncbi:MAG: hypothetical protein A2538_00280 [Candidatus Magasanikbacteria bacterium RIFOXYD2_FULL_41_14]|uniref:Transcription regulator TrmB N-terminal domain-containing protein n=1 Tax=Candidatus Magasanikbacteria bacterium RIFOXYD2_FULL_41_14 TaxID=1798709 RepID=A0A1F6PEI8_9BACT|nr:MAG: hypothetical protein A2538_00280 [Candidatus Magasanikbacteria bacterium RIFOXYD2_FULL_41_14]
MAKQKSPSQITNILSTLGVGEHEAQLYVLMLKNAPGTAQELQLLSHIPRTLLYYLLRQLVAVGLVGARKEKWRTIYRAVDPEHLYELLSQREQAVATDAIHLRRLIPDLRRSYRLAGARPGIKTFDGMAEYDRALLAVVASRPGVIRTYRPFDQNKKPGLEAREMFADRCVAKKIKTKILLPDDPASRALVLKTSYNDYTQFRLEKSTLSGGVDIMIYSGKILYTTYNSHEPSALLVEDVALAQWQEKQFDYIWDKSTDITLLSINEKLV